MKSLILAGVVLASSALAAAAGTVDVTFKFAGDGGLFGPTEYMSDGKTVKLAAVNIYSDTGKIDEYGGTIGQWDKGLGVCRDIGYSYHGAYCDDLHTVDGAHGNDLILFDFGEMVKVVSAKFTHVGSDDDLVFADYSGGVAPGDVPAGFTYDDIDGPYAGYVGYYDFGGIHSSIFGIGAIDGCDCGTDGRDEWKLYSLTVAYKMPSVPLPASAFLMLGGLGAVALLRRKRLT